MKTVLIGLFVVLGMSACASHTQQFDQAGYGRQHRAADKAYSDLDKK